MAGLRKIVSGGQTGVDQAALRAARASGIAIGGWCPPGRACEGGTIPVEFPLEETANDTSPTAPDIPRSRRTEWNVRDSDATLILVPGAGADADAGTRWAIECAEKLGKPVLVCDPGQSRAAEKVREWLSEARIEVLNVAGPSEGGWPGIGAAAERFLIRVLTAGSPSATAGGCQG